MAFAWREWICVTSLENRPPCFYLPLNFLDIILISMNSREFLYKLHLVLAFCGVVFLICAFRAFRECYVEPCEEMPGLSIMFRVSNGLSGFVCISALLFIAHGPLQFSAHIHKPT